MTYTPSPQPTSESTCTPPEFFEAGESRPAYLIHDHTD